MMSSHLALTLVLLTPQAVSQPSPPQAQRLWVFFEDKGPIDVDAELRRVETSYGRRAIERRRLRRTAPGLFDVRDIPVWSGYEDAVRSTGATFRTSSSWLNAISVEATPSQALALAALEGVERLQPFVEAIVEREDPVVAGPAEPAPEDASTAVAHLVGGLDYGMSESQLAQIRMLGMHELGYTGAGVAIGVLDGGFMRHHEAFREVDVIAEYDFIDDDPNTDLTPGDSTYQLDHGTAVLGVLAAYQPGVLIGGAFDAQYILARSEDRLTETYAEEDMFVAGVQFIEAQGGDVATSSLIARRKLYGVDQLDGETSTMTLAFNVATENGVHCVQAVGNTGHDGMADTASLLAPADSFLTISVGALTPQNNTADFSSSGPTADGRVKPEVMARGQEVATVHRTAATGVEIRNGTSFAAPLVASAVASLVQVHPEWTVEQMRQALLTTATRYTVLESPHPLFVIGYGKIRTSQARQWSDGPGTIACMGVDCPCDNHDTVGGCANSTGRGPLLTATGSASVAADDLVLEAERFPANNSALFFMGDDVFAPITVGDGLACTGGLFRFFLATVSGTGTIDLSSPVAAAPAGTIQAGDTRVFQAWSRDVLCGPPPAPCPTPCGNGSTLSNAYRVTFTR